MAIARKDSEYNTNKDRIIKQTRDKFVVCMFLNGANRKWFGRCVDGLNNDYLAGNKHYPETVEKALEYLQNYRDSNQIVKKGKRHDEDGKTGATFAQSGGGVTCYKCGEQGHISTKCGYDSDDEKVISYRKAWKEKKKAITNVQVRTGVQF